MPPSAKPFLDLQWRQRQRIIQTIHDLFEAHCPTLPHATALLQQLFTKCSSFLPGLSLENQAFSQLLGKLGHLRQSLADRMRTSNIGAPSISVAQLDMVVSSMPCTLQELVDSGYAIGKTSYRQARSANLEAPQSSRRNPGGRPRKISDAPLHDTVRSTLAPYLQESEKVVVVGRGSRRQFVLAQHLSKKRLQIYKAETALNQILGKDIFYKILKIYIFHTSKTLAALQMFVPRCWQSLFLFFSVCMCFKALVLKDAYVLKVVASSPQAKHVQHR